MVEKLRHNWPDDWQAILEANNTQAPMTLRVNALRFSRDDYLQLLSEAGIEANANPFRAPRHSAGHARCRSIVCPGFPKTAPSVCRMKQPSSAPP